ADAHHEGQHPGDGAVPADLPAVPLAVGVLQGVQVVVGVVVGAQGAVVAVPVVGALPAGTGAGGLRLGGLGSGPGGGQEAFDGGRRVDPGRAYEVLVEDHGGELFVRHPAVVVVVGLPAVRERRAPHVLRHGSRVDLGGQFGQTVRKFAGARPVDRKSTRLNSGHVKIS